MDYMVDLAVPCQERLMITSKIGGSVPKPPKTRSGRHAQSSRVCSQQSSVNLVNITLCYSQCLLIFPGSHNNGMNISPWCCILVMSTIPRSATFGHKGHATRLHFSVTSCRTVLDKDSGIFSSYRSFPTGFYLCIFDPLSYKNRTQCLPIPGVNNVELRARRNAAGMCQARSYEHFRPLGRTCWL